MQSKSKSKESDGVILIDLSSYVFYRNFAIHKWKAAAKLETLDDETFRSKFKKLFVENILGYAKKLKVPVSNVVFAQDCPRASIWRMNIYPEYKKTRVRDIANFDPYVFQMTYEELIPKMEEQYGVRVCSVEGAEADDIIAVLARQLKAQMKTVYILSCDNDFIQLVDENIQVMDFQMKTLVKGVYEKLFDVYLTWKLIYGDESDNIPSIDKKIGKVTAETLARNPQALALKLENPQVKANFERNAALIDMNRIPEYIVARIISAAAEYKWD